MSPLPGSRTPVTAATSTTNGSVWRVCSSRVLSCILVVSFFSCLHSVQGWSPTLNIHTAQRKTSLSMLAGATRNTVLSPRSIQKRQLETSTMTSAAARLYSSASTNKQPPSQQNSNNSNNNNNNNNNKRKEKVAIIGGGIAGLSCAQTLASSGQFESITVFDTGRLRPGGRCSSRMVGDRPNDDNGVVTSGPILSRHIIDHAAQILTVPQQQKGGGGHYDAFQQQVKEWEEQGIIVRYPTGTVCEIKSNNDPKKGSTTKTFYLNSLNTQNRPPMYYGVNGMGSIPLSMSSKSSFTLEQDVWVSPSNGVKYQRGMTQNWKLQTNGKLLGMYDQLIIAHNGKCADRIMSKTPAKDLHSLLRVNFSSSVPKWGGKKMTLNSIYSLSIVLPSSTSPLTNVLPKNEFVCGFIQNEPTLRFLSCQTRKYNKNKNNNKSTDTTTTNNDDDVEEVWTILSSPTFAKKYKAPQEFLPPDTVVNVTSLMLQAVERSLNLQPGSISSSNQVLESRLQLWGAAVPLNVWNSNKEEAMASKEESSSSSSSSMPSGFIYDAEFGTGVCGDWLLEPSIAGAWESGRRLGQHMVEQQQKEQKPQSVGLPSNGGQFQVSQKASKIGIGAL